MRPLEQAVDPVAPVAGALRRRDLVGAHRAGGLHAPVVTARSSPPRQPAAPPGKPEAGVHKTASANACAGKRGGARRPDNRGEAGRESRRSARHRGDSDDPAATDLWFHAPDRGPRPGRRAGRAGLAGARPRPGRAGERRLRDRRAPGPGRRARRSARSRTSCSGPSSRTPPAASTSRARSGRSSSSAPTTAATSRPACAPTRS